MATVAMETCLRSQPSDQDEHIGDKPPAGAIVERADQLGIGDLLYVECWATVYQVPGNEHALTAWIVDMQYPDKFEPQFDNIQIPMQWNILRQQFKPVIPEEIHSASGASMARYGFGLAPNWVRLFTQPFKMVTQPQTSAVFQPAKLHRAAGFGVWGEGHPTKTEWGGATLIGTPDIVEGPDPRPSEDVFAAVQAVTAAVAMVTVANNELRTSVEVMLQE